MQYQRLGLSHLGQALLDQGFAATPTSTHNIACKPLPYVFAPLGLLTHEGRVVRLTSRATILLTLDGNHVQIPTATVFNAIILNFSRNPQRRFEFDLGIDASDNPVDGMDVGLSAVNALPFVLDTPKASAVIRDVGDSNIVLRFDEAAPSPAQGMQLQAARPVPKAAKPPAPPNAGVDTAPDSHVEKLVDEERAFGNQNDLLSDRRPVE